MSIISKFKYSWDNKQFMTANYKMVADLQRTARANMERFIPEVKRRSPPLNK